MHASMLRVSAAALISFALAAVPAAAQKKYDPGATDTEIKVGNIVPSEKGALDYSEYNSVLQDFVRRIAGPAAQKTGFAVETTPARQSLDDWLTPQSAEALRRFSEAANKSKDNFLAALSHELRTPLNASSVSRRCLRRAWPSG